MPYGQGIGSGVYQAPMMAPAYGNPMYAQQPMMGGAYGGDRVW